ncbi:Hypothetical predicted protein [Marmota monax]|uniref:Uncharacterized protein n=1 Tax=Marmota monax TaxID=9995 RepID=A0A5E4AA27_MARMO|nr:Hypothetical predicted protein [Marmota monax]
MITTPDNTRDVSLGTGRQTPVHHDHVGTSDSRLGSALPCSFPVHNNGRKLPVKTVDPTHNSQKIRLPRTGSGLSRHTAEVDRAVTDNQTLDGRDPQCR